MATAAKSKLRRALEVLGILVAFFGLVLLLLWNDRPKVEELQVDAWEGPLPARDGRSELRAVWWGVATLLIDDGETQILIDGFFSRPSVWQAATMRPVVPDDAAIDAALARLDARRVAAVIPVHSHFDHLMDSPTVARRTGATILGSRSTGNYSRAQGIDDARLIELPDGGTRALGKFEIELINSKHAPIGRDAGPPMPGEIDEDFSLPAPITAWREGGSYSLVLRHPAGTILIQGSAGYVPGSLGHVKADLVLLGLGGLGGLDQDYFDTYWHEIMTVTEAPVAVPIHFDDFSTPADDDELKLFPRFLDDVGASFEWMRVAAERSGTTLRMLPRRDEVRLFSPAGRPLQPKPR